MRRSKACKRRSCHTVSRSCVPKLHQAQAEDLRQRASAAQWQFVRAEEAEPRQRVKAACEVVMSTVPEQTASSCDAEVWISELRSECCGSSAAISLSQPSEVWQLQDRLRASLPCHSLSARSLPCCRTLCGRSSCRLAAAKPSTRVGTRVPCEVQELRRKDSRAEREQDPQSCSPSQQPSGAYGQHFVWLLYPRLEVKAQMLPAFQRRDVFVCVHGRRRLAKRWRQPRQP